MNNPELKEFAKQVRLATTKIMAAAAQGRPERAGELAAELCTRAAAAERQAKGAAVATLETPEAYDLAELRLSEPVLGVVFESTVWSGRAPEGHVLLRCIFGGGRDPDAASLPDDALIAQARRDLATALAVTAEPTHASVVRWRRGVAQYGLGHRDRVRDATALARGQRIALAGADYRGPGLNDLCADGATVVAEVSAW